VGEEIRRRRRPKKGQKRKVQKSSKQKKTQTPVRQVRHGGTKKRGGLGKICRGKNRRVARYRGGTDGDKVEGHCQPRRKKN